VCTTTSALSFGNDSVLSVESESIVPATLIEVLAGATVPLISVPAGVSLLLYTDGGVEVQNLAGGAVPVIGLPTATSSLTWFAAGGLSTPSGPTVTGIAGSTLAFVALDSLTQVPATATAWPSPGFAGTLTTTLGYVAPTFVYAPGSVSGAANVFTNGEELRQALASVKGPKWLYCDNTAGATHLTAGVWSLDQVHLGGSGNGTTLIIDSGATITFGIMWVEASIVVDNHAAAAPVAIAAGTHNLYVEGDATTIQSSVAAAFANVTGGFLGVFCAPGVGIGDGVHPAFNLAAAGGGSLVLVLTGPDTTINAHALAGTGTPTVLVGPDATLTTPQDSAGPTISYPALAAQVSYTPATAGNWQPAPTLVKAALDQLAAPNPISQAGNTGTGTGTVTVTSGNIAKKRSGLVLLVATITGSIAASAAVTAQLVRDAATNIGSPSSCTPLSAADVFSLTCVFIDTLPDAANHTYKLSTTSAQNLTVAATSTQISAVEL
jgi:hypothetical protein